MVLNRQFPHKPKRREIALVETAVTPGENAEHQHYDIPHRSESYLSIRRPLLRGLMFSLCAVAAP
jgi:hypothetical protein